MKNIFKTVCLVNVLLIGTSACQSKKDMNTEQSSSHYFATPQEAAQKAKSDFIEILQSGKDIKMNIALADLKEAKDGNMINHATLDFNQFISTTDSLVDFNSLTKVSQKGWVPFIKGNTIVSVAELSNDDKGWKVTALGNKQLTVNLNAIIGKLQGNPEYQVMIYEIPNINAGIYQLKIQQADSYYTDYNGFNINEEVQLTSLVYKVRNDAIEFNRKFGDMIKKDRLVK